MRFLLSSIVLILCCSCASYPKKNGFESVISEQSSVINPYFSDATKDYVYKANIEAFGNSFTGIFVVKKLGEHHHRIAFTTEMGNKIFDFTYLNDDFKVNHILKKMDKKILVTILKNDFKVLVEENVSIEKAFQKDTKKMYETQLDNKSYYYFTSADKLKRIVRINNGKEKVEFLFSEINDQIAKHIEILHQNFNLAIVLKAL